jgi:hypothetical protein
MYTESQFFNKTSFIYGWTSRIVQRRGGFLFEIFISTKSDQKEGNESKNYIILNNPFADTEFPKRAIKKMYITIEKNARSLNNKPLEAKQFK